MKSIKIDYFEYFDKLKLKTIDKDTHIFDPIRKKYIKLLPEEFVRQLCLEYLLTKKKYSKNHIRVERTLKYKEFTRRYDILVLTKNAVPHILIECKAPNIKLNQKVLDQVSHYNLMLKVPYLFITNGTSNYCFELNDTKDSYDIVNDIPSYQHNSKK